MTRATLCSLLVFCALLIPGGVSAETQADREITYLLDYVANSGCTFVRNGDHHASPDAADHLRLKYSRGKRYAGSAEQFIDRLATGSSWSGDAYTVICEGETETSAAWLHGALEEYRQSSVVTAPEAP